MSPLGERLVEFLRTQPDVTAVRDESTATTRGQLVTEQVTCRVRGADYCVMVMQRYPR